MKYIFYFVIYLIDIAELGVVKMLDGESLIHGPICLHSGWFVFGRVFIVLFFQAAGSKGELLVVLVELSEIATMHKFIIVKIIFYIHFFIFLNTFFYGD
jgi:hypothetical protein